MHCTKTKQRKKEKSDKLKIKENIWIADKAMLIKLIACAEHCHYNVSYSNCKINNTSTHSIIISFLALV